MASYKITSSAGVEMGIFNGATEAEALDAMARDAGYRDRAHAVEVAGEDKGMRVEEVDPRQYEVLEDGTAVGTVEADDADQALELALARLDPANYPAEALPCEITLAVVDIHGEALSGSRHLA